MFVRLLETSFLRRKRRKLIALAAVALGTATATALANVALDVGDRISRELRSFGANLVIEPAGGGSRAVLGGEDLTHLRARAYLSEADIPKVKENFWKNNIISFAPILDAPARVSGETVILRGTWFERRLALDGGDRITTGIRDLYPYWSVRGNWPNDLSATVTGGVIESDPGTARSGEMEAADPAKRAAGEVLVGSVLASKLNVLPGRILEVEIGGRAWTLSVAGILSTGGEEDGAILAVLEVVQRLTNLPGKVDRILASALTTPENAVYERMGVSPREMPAEEFEKWTCTPFVSSIAYELSRSIPGSEARPIRRIADSEGKILGKVGGLMGFVAVLAGLASAMTVMSALTTGVLERRIEIGLFKALGAADSGVVRLFLAEAALIGLAGGIAGGAAGMLLARAITMSVFGVPGSIKVLSLPIAVGAALCITLVGCALPARRIVGLQAAEALRG